MDALKQNLNFWGHLFLVELEPRHTQKSSLAKRIHQKIWRVRVPPKKMQESKIVTVVEK